MNPRQQTAGTTGILAGVSLVILFILFLTTGLTPKTLADPAKALPFVAQNTQLWRAIMLFATIAVALAVFFVAGLAAKLREKAPTRATGVLYFGLLGLVGHGMSALVQGLAAPSLAAYASTDAVAASHAWVALNALTGATDGFGSVFTGLSILLAGWVIARIGVMSSSLGWFGVVAGLVNVLSGEAPSVGLLFLGSIVFSVIWLIWAGSALRKSTTTRFPA